MTLEKEVISAVGFMSGTSMDGVDVAHLETDGQAHIKRGPSKTYPYSQKDREALGRLIEKGAAATPAEVAEGEELVTRAHIRAFQAFQEEFQAPAVALIGFHGHTLVHSPTPTSDPVPRPGYTRQLGFGQHLADETGVPVVYDFRTNDVKEGGQGAPLAPIYHKALLGAGDRPRVLVNIGGVSNVTYVDGETLLAFDVGPGNALIDDWVRSRGNLPYDEGGRLGLKGHVAGDVLGALLSHPYFLRKPPKSLDRNEFHEISAGVEGLSLEDGCATLAAFTAGALAAAAELFPKAPEQWILTGGGRRNQAIVSALKVGVGESAVQPIEALGYDGDALEAELMAYLAVRSSKGLPLSFPGTTGAPRPTTGGICAFPARRKQA